MGQRIEHPPAARKIMGSIPIGDTVFSLSHARVVLIISSFILLIELKIHHNFIYLLRLIMLVIYMYLSDISLNIGGQ